MLAKGVVLKVKLGIGVGRATVLHVGGVYKRIEYLASGPPLTQAFMAEHAAVAGDIIVSNEGWEYIKERFEGLTVDDHNVKVTNVFQTNK